MFGRLEGEEDGAGLAAADEAAEAAEAHAEDTDDKEENNESDGAIRANKDEEYTGIARLSISVADVED